MKHFKQPILRLQSLRNDKTGTFPSIIIAIGVFLGFFNFISPSPFNLVIEVICSIICIFFSGIKWNEKNRKQLGLLVFLVFIAWIFNVVSVVIQGGFNPLRLATLAYMLFSVIVSYVLINNVCISLWPLKVVFYLVGFYFIYELVILEVPPLEIFNDAGGGLMNSLLLSIAIPVQLLDYRRNRKVAIIPPIVIVIVSIYSVSRTAMLCAAIYLLIIVFFISFRTTSKKFLGVLFFSVVIILIVSMVINHWDEIMALEIYEKFDEQGVDSSGRTDIWRFYLTNMNLFYFLFGRNVDINNMILGFANTHNSFIKLHSQIGILGILYIIYILRASFHYLKNDFFTFLLLLVLFLRCFFDTPYFFSVFDYALIVFFIDYKKQTQLVSKDDAFSYTLL